MKRLLLLPLVVFLLSSCEITLVEEPAPIIIVEDTRQLFTGYFEAEEYSFPTDSYAFYTIRILKSNRPDNIIFIRNFYGLGIEVLAEVHGNTLFIPEQDVEGYHIVGDGSIVQGELKLNYSVLDLLNPHGFVDDCETFAYR